MAEEEEDFTPKTKFEELKEGYQTEITILNEKIAVLEAELSDKETRLNALEEPKE